MKSIPDVERFTRYQSVISVLLTKESFKKHDIYEVLKDEQRSFIGKVIGELARTVTLSKTA